MPARRPTVCGLAALTATCALLTGASVARAAGVWGTVETVSRLPGPANAAIDDRGYIVLTWSRGEPAETNRRVYGARRTPTRGFGEPFGLQTADEGRLWHGVTFDAERNAIVAWHRQTEDGNSTQSRTVRPNGARTDTVTIADIAGDHTHFAAVAPGERAQEPVLGWQVGGAPMVELALADAGVLTDAVRENLADDEFYGVEQPRFALRNDGTLVAVYEDGPLLVSERPPGGSFGPPQRVSVRGANTDQRIAIGPDGTIAVAWLEIVDADRRTAFVSVRSPGGTFTTPVQVSEPGERPLKLDVVITTDGTVRLAYLAAGYDGNRNLGPVRLVTLDGERETLTPEGLDAVDLAMAADGRGGTTVAWQRRGARPFYGQRNAIFARAITSSGRVGQRWKLTRTGEDGGDLALAVGPDGSALAAWTAGESRLGDRLRAVRRGRTG